MLNKASALFSRRGADLQSYIYGTSALTDMAKNVGTTVSLNGPTKID
jgi:hypothetical protein